MAGGEENHSPASNVVKRDTDGKLSVPYQCPLTEFTGRTHRLRVVGTPLPSARSFRVEFKAGNGDVLFHFEPRFDVSPHVENSCFWKMLGVMDFSRMPSFGTPSRRANRRERSDRAMVARSSRVDASHSTSSRSRL